MATDQQLLRDYARGTDAAFAELTRRHLNLVYSVARRYVGESDAEDMTQAVFALMAAKSDVLVHHVSLAGWLHDATRYCCQNHIRLTQRRRKYESEAAMHHQLKCKEISAQTQQDLREILDEAIARLNITEREAVLLRYLENNSIEETAQTLKISTDAAAKRAVRGLNRLRKILGARGVAVPIVTLGALLTAETVHAIPADLYRTAAAAPNSSAACNAANILGEGFTGARCAVLSPRVLIQIAIILFLILCIAGGMALMMNYHAPAAHPNSNRSLLHSLIEHRLTAR